MNPLAPKPTNLTSVVAANGVLTLGTTPTSPTVPYVNYARDATGQPGAFKGSLLSSVMTGDTALYVVSPFANANNTPATSATPTVINTLTILTEPELVAAAPDLVSFLNTSAGNRYESAAGAFNAEDPGTIRLRVRINTVPTAGTKVICGFSGAGTGFVVWTQDKSGAVLANPQLCVFAGVDAGIPQVAEKVILAEQVGTVLTIHIVFDGAKVRTYIDGEEIGLGLVTTGFGVAYTAYNRPSAALAIGDLPGGGFAGEQSVVELAWSSTRYTRDQVRADTALAIGAPMLTETHHWTTGTTPVTTWVDTGSGKKNLTKIGSPTVSTKLAYQRRVKRTWNAWGDSIVQGYRPGPISDGDSWRRRLQHSMSALGLGLTWVGGSAPTTPVVGDYDYWNNGTSGEALVTRLATFAANLPNAGGPRVGSVISYGTNDFVVSSRTAAQFAADLKTAVGLHRTARPGAPVLITCPMPVASSVGTAGQRAQLTAFRASWPGVLAGIQGSYPDVPIAGVDLGVAITNPNDVAQLFDGIHPTLATYDALADLMVPAMRYLLSF